MKSDDASSNADVKFVEDVKDPNTQVATSLTEHEGTARASANTSGTDLSKDMDSSQRRIRNAVVSIESTRAIDEAKAQKKRDVALAGLAEGASTTAVDKTYQDDMAKALFAWQQGYANLTYDEGSEQLRAVTSTITKFGQAGKKYVEDTAGDEKLYTDALAPIIGTRTVSYIQAGIALLKASTGADNIWRNNTAQAWATHTGGDSTARGNTQRGVANASSLLADASRASIAEHKAQWWQTEIPNYLQWSADVGAMETTYTDDTTDNILQRAIAAKNAGVKYASDVGIAIKDYDVNTAAAREEYISKLMTIAKSIGDTLLDAERDKEIALADAELQKQLTGNESAYSSAVQAANDAYNNTTTSAEASRKSQEQTARSTMNTKLSDELKNKEADIAAAERLYDQTVASLDAQYGSESSKGDTGVEGATRRSAIKTRDAQYYAARDTSWANTLSGSTTLGTSPWTVKAISAANAQAAHSVSRASAQAAHDAAMLDAIEDWQLSSRESLTDLLFTEGQSRETYNVATSNVYANWENGVGNLLGGKPEGTGWEGRTGENNTETTNGEYGGMGGFLNFNWFGEEDEEESDTPERPEEPSIAQSVSVNIVGYRDWLKSMPIITPKGTLIRGGIVKGVRDWGIDVIAGAIALGAHDTIKKVERTPNADAAYFLAWAGESDIPTLMTANVPINSRRVEYLQSLAKEKALDLNIGHAELGVASSTFLDEVTLEGAATVATGASSKLLSTSLRISSKVTSNSIELALKSARRFDNEAIEAASKGTQLLDTADSVPLEKVLDDAPVGGAALTQGLESRPAPNSFIWDRFQRWVAGNTEYRVVGGGESYWADGIEGTTLIEAKYAGAATSVYKPWSSASEISVAKMKGVIDRTYDEFRRARDIIADPNTPWTKLQVRTNDFEARSFFERIMHDLDVPGEVIVYPRF